MNVSHAHDCWFQSLHQLASSLGTPVEFTQYSSHAINFPSLLGGLIPLYSKHEICILFKCYYVTTMPEFKQVKSAEFLQNRTQEISECVLSTVSILLILVKAS